MDNIRIKIQKEKEVLEDLLVKRNKLNEKIKEKEVKIDELNKMLNQRKFSEMTDVLSSKGLSIEELLSAIETGDLLTLQEKLEEKENAKGIDTNKEV